MSAGRVAVAGGGVIGLTLAWRLAQRGFTVSVFDKGSLGGEASWAAAGMLAPGGEIGRGSPLALDALEARRLYAAFVEELEEASGIGVDFRECGALDLAYTDTEQEELAARVRAQNALGIRSEALTAAQARDVSPWIAETGLLGARFYSDDAVVDPRALVAALLAACQGLGVSLMAQQAVTSVVIGDRSVKLESVAGVSEFDAFVVAAGAWSNLIPISGVGGERDLPVVEPVKGYLIGYRRPVDQFRTILRRGHTYLLQRAGGLLIAGSSEERVGFDRGVEPGMVSELAGRATQIVPALAGEMPSEAWTGLRPGSEMPRTSAADGAGRLYLAYGHYRNGILLAPLTARDLTAEISANSGRR
jgi:glycine oxidase